MPGFELCCLQSIIHLRCSEAHDRILAYVGNVGERLEKPQIA